MPFNSHDILQEIRAEFEEMLEFVTGEEASMTRIALGWRNTRAGCARAKPLRCSMTFANWPKNPRRPAHSASNSLKPPLISSGTCLTWTTPRGGWRPGFAIGRGRL